MEDILALFGMGSLRAVVLCGRGGRKIAGRMSEGLLCCFVASLASLSAFSLPGIPLCPGIQ